MQFQPLPTPLQALRRLWQNFVGVLLVLAIALVFSAVSQVVLVVSGLLIAFTGHWVIGLIMIIAAGLAYHTRKAMKF
jgi:hypothetical protein